MKHVLSSLAIVTLLLGAGACTMDDESPDVDLSALELRSDFEVIIVQPATPRDPSLAASDLPAKAGPGALSFGSRHYIGGASSALAAEDAPAPDLAFPGHPLDTRWTQQANPLDTAGDRPIYEGHELSTSTDLPQQLDDPCLCTGADCLRDWVDANVGCDVCAVFVCGGDVNPHACNACE